ncbi:MAG: ribosomal subunit interface protein [Candidatus Syntrophoarchaeum caldarius]|uniref:RNA 3'-terminal phosphate cyclase n=1 Tax=Candidatus Syntropharchaeum caldarium TaxID=1838285 RepID=A0A1F2PA28_9EURY|nr:MAG: ribosomal subunit interface protein [Candidatus Syntrophoarchaeum caldarius]
MIEIDGSMGEGGGQIIRTAIAFATITETPVKIRNIRVGRPKPGLAMQHLTGIEFLAKLTDATVEGLKLGSKELFFAPHRVRGGKFDLDIKTAGSITLFLQTVIPALLDSDERLEITIKGGTDVRWSPPIDFYRFLLIPVLRKMGADIEIELLRRGYYPKGNGLVRALINSSKLRGITPEAQMNKRVKGISHASNLPEHVVRRQADSAEAKLLEHGISASIELESTQEISTGSGIFLYSGYKSGSALGERGKRAEVVGAEAAENILSELGTAARVDIYLADQLIPYMALAEGRSEISVREMTGHLKTNISVVEAFMGRIFDVETREGIIHIMT